MNKVAVYGTLRSGFHNNYLLGKSLCFGLARAKFPSVMFSAGGFPKLDLLQDKGLPPIVAEIYECTDDVLHNNLDALEGYPGWYDRTMMDFELESGEVVSAWIYHQEVPDGRPVVESGDWAEFCNKKYSAGHY